MLSAHRSHVVVFLFNTVIFTMLDRVFSYENEHQIAKWKVSLDGLSSAESSQSPTTTGAPNKNIRLVDWREWQLMKSYNHPTGESHSPMLIVATEEVVLRDDSRTKLESKTTPRADLPAEAFEDEAVAKEVEENLHIEKTIAIPRDQTTTTQTTSTTTSEVHPSTTLPVKLSSSTEVNLAPQPPTNLFFPSQGMDLKSLPSLFMLLKQLTLIPAVVRSLSGTGTTPLTSAATSSSHSLLGMLTGSALDSGSNLGVTTSPGLEGADTQLFSLKRSAAQNSIDDGRNESPSKEEELSGIDPIVPVMTTSAGKAFGRPLTESSASKLKLSSKDRFNRLNIYGLDGSALAAAAPHKTGPYVAPLFPRQELPKKKLKPRFDLSDLTVHEVEQLESIHRKLFNGSSISSDYYIEPQSSVEPENIRQHIRQRLSNEHTKSGEVAHQMKGSKPSVPNSLLSMLGKSSLEPKMIDDLLAVKDLPDLEELTAGMDLSLLNQPGGFATLKQQFIERLVQRSLIGKRS